MGAAALPGDQQRQIGAPGAGVGVDFLAVNTSGQPVTDLKAEEVTIRIAGKPRAISSLEYVKTSGGGGPVSALPAPFAVNAAASGRTILIVIDNESLRVGAERAIKESLESLLSQLGSSDRVALSFAPRDTVHTGYGGGVAAVRAALANFIGGKPNNETDADANCRTRDTLTLLRTLMEGMAGSETPTTLLYIGGNLMVPATTVQRRSSSNRSSGDNSTCEVMSEAYNGIAAAVATGRVNMYVAQGDESVTSRDAGLENLAGAGSAGGSLRAVQNGLNRVVTDSAGYYLATVAPDPGDRPGQTQKLDVRVGRADVSTRARADVAIVARGAKAGGKAATPREMVATTQPFTDLPLRAVAVASRGAAGKMSILAMAEPVEPGTKLTALTAILIAPGVAKAAYVASADDKQLAAKTVTVPMVADPGKYRLRVAATDASGRSGAVDYDLDATLTPAGSIQLGQLLLLGPRGESFSPQLIFQNEAEMAAYVEIYGFDGKSKIGAKIEIAATADGPAVVQGQVGGQATTEPDKFILNAKIPIASLAPGDYVVRAVVQVEGQPEGKAMRTMRKIK